MAGGDRASKLSKTASPEDPPAPEAARPVQFDLDEHIFYLFGQVYGRRNRDLAETLRGFGLTNPKYRVLTALTNRDGCSINTLAELTVVERTTLSRALDQMEADGLIRRVPRDSDKRTIEIWLTTEGWRRLEAVWPEIVAHNERAVAGLSAGEVAALKAILRKMGDNVRDPDS